MRPNLRLWRQRWRRYRALRPADRRLYHRVWCLLLRIRVELIVLPYATWRARWLDRVGPALASLRGDPDAVERVAWSVRHASRFIPGSRTCLVQALAAYQLLRPLGIPVDIEIGARFDDRGQLRAHAWVTVLGRVIVGAEDAEAAQRDYQRLGALDPATPDADRDPPTRSAGL